LQARINVAEREALEKAGIDPNKYGPDESLKEMTTASASKMRLA
jgi:hypothetical protein